MPAIFISHGSPENAFETNSFSQTWKNIAASFSTPKAILVISAHWTNRMSDKVNETSVVVVKEPETIHDFYGFPDSFYEFNYPAPGDPILAQKIISAVKTLNIKTSTDWGLDHGAWSVLAQMYPTANIPTLQLSIDENLAPEKMFALGQELGQLRAEGVLILGSGNIVHNLGAIAWNGTAYPWATEFDEFVKTALITKNYSAIINFTKHPLLNLALPTTEHFLPLLYVLGAANNATPKFFCEEIFAASLSMRCVVYID